MKDGFPFFRGDITLFQNVEISEKNINFKYEKRFQMIELFVNDKKVDTLMFNNEVNISKFVKTGTNRISIVLTVSNRNLLGPHHAELLEDQWVGPQTFERFGTWDENGVSPHCPVRYSFVKVIE